MALPKSLHRKFSVLLAIVCLGADGSTAAQELRVQPTPFSVWLEFPTKSRSAPPSGPLPIWLEAVHSQHVAPTRDAGALTHYRLRLRRMPQLHSSVQLRLYFDDKPNAAPVVSAWSETGVLRFQSAPLGTGLNLATSELLSIPVTAADYIEITVPGDGSSLRGAFVTSLKRVDAQSALDFVPETKDLDPFQKSDAITPRENDSYLYGRVRATLEPGTIKLEPGKGSDQVTYEVDLDTAPLLALVTFEALGTDFAALPELTVNDLGLGAVTPMLPDLADLAYLGNVRPLEADLRFRYTGWLRCQRLIPGSALRQGLNRITFKLNKESGPVAIRAVELQLKHHWQNFDYTISP